MGRSNSEVGWRGGCLEQIGHGVGMFGGKKSLPSVDPRRQLDPLSLLFSIYGMNCFTHRLRYSSEVRGIESTVNDIFSQLIGVIGSNYRDNQGSIIPQVTALLVLQFKCVKIILDP